MIVELHCHSRRSDGTDPPAEVARRAAAAGVTLFCLTDHDTWAGHPETVGVAPGMRVLRGLELTCGERGRPVHLLVYGPAEGAGLERLAATVAGLAERRRARLAEICARFERWGIRLDPAAILAKAAGATPGRPHVAAALLEAGVVRSVREAFDRFLKDGGPADVPSPRLPVEEGVALAAAAGARVSLAHPHTVGHPHVARGLLGRAREAGLGGLEAFYGPYAVREREGWLEMAAALDLVVTGGSDYHGAMTPEVPRPGIELPEPHAARLREWLAGA